MLIATKLNLTNVNNFFLPIILCYKRGICTSCILNGSRQVGIAMNKILGKKRKKDYYYEEKSNSLPTFTKQSTLINPKRVVVLNKLFMRNITDLMSTGVFASSLFGLGVVISKVKITHDYKFLNVYWTANTLDVDKADEILKKYSNLLKHELSVLRLMGNTPTIQFVKDKNYGICVELDKRLAVADYGEEGPINSDPAAHLLSEFELALPLEKKIKDKIVKLEEENPLESEELQLPNLPVMTHCVFDLNHEAIMGRIKKASSKARPNYQINENNDWANLKLNQYLSSDSKILENPKEQREAFTKFLKQRQIIKSKRLKMKEDTLSFVEDYEVYSTVSNNKDDDDYILEDVDEDNESK